LCEISESETLSTRFAKALKDRGGTLVLSWLNVVEFSKMTDEVQRRKADLLLNEIALNVFWLNPDFFTVGSDELNLASNNENPPHSDSEFLYFYVMSGLKNSPGPQILIAPPLFTTIKASDQIPPQYDELADQIIFQLEDLRKEFDASPAMRSAAKKLPKSGKFPRGTRIIAKALIGRFLKDKSLKLNRNNAVDLTHAVVSVAYCDYVLLDTQWLTLVDQIRRDLAKRGIAVPMAKVFSKKSNGVETFLAELEDQKPIA
jgi:hypothetical protein